MSVDFDFKILFRCIFIFLLSLVILLIFGNYTNSMDPMYNFGFSYSIAKGEIPYRDFTMIVPPLYNFVMSIGLIIFSCDNLVFLIEQSLLISLTFYFLYKMYKEKAWFYLIALSFPVFSNFSPSYNYFLFFLTVILIYCENNKKNDYLVGFVLGSMLLTKYTAGIFLILPSLITCLNNKKKLFKRFIGLLFPCLIFLIYLIFNNAFFQFFDLCFLGLFDFAKKNTLIFTLYFYISFILFIISIYLLIKDKNNLVRWLVVLSYFIVFPNVSANHLYIYFLFCSLNFISSNIVFSEKIIYMLVFSVILSTFVCFSFALKFDFLNVSPAKLSNFKFYLNSSTQKKNISETNELYLFYKSKGKTYYLSSDTVWLRIINEEKTDYFTILNKGNYGYNGTKKMINKIKNMNDVYFIIDFYEYKYSKKNIFSQFDTEIVDYIVSNGKKIGSKKKYVIYYLD